MGSVFCADLTSVVFLVSSFFIPVLLNTNTGLVSVAPLLTVLVHLAKCMFDVKLWTFGSFWSFIFHLFLSPLLQILSPWDLRLSSDFGGHGQSHRRSLQTHQNKQNKQKYCPSRRLPVTWVMLLHDKLWHHSTWRQESIDIPQATGLV